MIFFKCIASLQSTSIPISVPYPALPSVPHTISGPHFEVHLTSVDCIITIYRIWFMNLHIYKSYGNRLLGGATSKDYFFVHPYARIMSGVTICSLSAYSSLEHFVIFVLTLIIKWHYFHSFYLTKPRWEVTFTINQAQQCYPWYILPTLYGYKIRILKVIYSIQPSILIYIAIYWMRAGKKHPVKKGHFSMFHGFFYIFEVII